MELIVFVIALFVLAGLSMRYGADSRPVTQLSLDGV
jgi:hypothetical protein